MSGTVALDGERLKGLEVLKSPVGVRIGLTLSGGSACDEGLGLGEEVGLTPASSGVDSNVEVALFKREPERETGLVQDPLVD